MFWRRRNGGALRRAFRRGIQGTISIQARIICSTINEEASNNPFNLPTTSEETNANSVETKMPIENINNNGKEAAPYVVEVPSSEISSSESDLDIDAHQKNVKKDGTDWVDNFVAELFDGDMLYDDLLMMPGRELQNKKDSNNWTTMMGIQPPEEEEVLYETLDDLFGISEQQEEVDDCFGGWLCEPRHNSAANANNENNNVLMYGGDDNEQTTFFAYAKPKNQQHPHQMARPVQSCPARLNVSHFYFNNNPNDPQQSRRSISLDSPLSTLYCVTKCGESTTIITPVKNGVTRTRVSSSVWRARMEDEGMFTTWNFFDDNNTTENEDRISSSNFDSDYPSTMTSSELDSMQQSTSNGNNNKKFQIASSIADQALYPLVIELARCAQLASAADFRSFLQQCVQSPAPIFHQLTFGHFLRLATRSSIFSEFLDNEKQRLDVLFEELRKQSMEPEMDDGIGKED